MYFKPSLVRNHQHPRLEIASQTELQLGGRQTYWWCIQNEIEADWKLVRLHHSKPDWQAELQVLKWFDADLENYQRKLLIQTGICVRSKPAVQHVEGNQRKTSKLPCCQGTQQPFLNVSSRKQQKRQTFPPSLSYSRVSWERHDQTAKAIRYSASSPKPFLFLDKCY